MQLTWMRPALSAIGLACVAAQGAGQAVKVVTGCQPNSMVALKGSANSLAGAEIGTTAGLLAIGCSYGGTKIVHPTDDLTCGGTVVSHRGLETDQRTDVAMYNGVSGDLLITTDFSQLSVYNPSCFSGDLSNSCLKHNHALEGSTAQHYVAAVTGSHGSAAAGTRDIAVLSLNGKVNWYGALTGKDTSAVEGDVGRMAIAICSDGQGRVLVGDYDNKVWLIDADGTTKLVHDNSHLGHGGVRVIKLSDSTPGTYTRQRQRHAVRCGRMHVLV